MDGAIAPPGPAQVEPETLATIAAAHAEAVDRDGVFPEAVIAALRARRLLGMMVPAAAGGAGAPLARVAEACHALAQGCASSAMIFAMHQIQVACLVAHAGASAWHRDALARIARDQLLLASATSEVGVGGNIRESRCAVEAMPDGRIAVEKQTTAISYGAQADMILLTARRTPAAAPSDQLLVALERSDLRLSRTTRWNALGMRGTCTDGFDVRAEADAAQILPVPFGTIATETMQPVAHILWAAVWCGVAADALARARRFLRGGMRRDAEAAPDGLGRLAAATETLCGAEAMVAAALRAYGEPGQAAAFLQDGRAATELTLLKSAVSDAALEVVGACFAICGIAAYRNEGPASLGRHLRDIQSAPLMVGNDRIRRNGGRLLLMARGTTPRFG